MDEELKKLPMKVAESEYSTRVPGQKPARAHYAVGDQAVLSGRAVIIHEVSDSSFYGVRYRVSDAKKGTPIVGWWYLSDLLPRMVAPRVAVAPAKTMRCPCCGEEIATDDR